MAHAVMDAAPIHVESRIVRFETNGAGVIPQGALVLCEAAVGVAAVVVGLGILWVQAYRFAVVFDGARVLA